MSGNAGCCRCACAFALPSRSRSQASSTRISSGAEWSRKASMPSSLQSQRGLYGVLNVDLIDEVVNLAALLENPAEVACRVLRQDLGDLSISKRCLQLAGDAHQLGRLVSVRLLLDVVKRPVKALNRIAYRMREFRIEKQKFQDALIRQVSGVDLAIGLECCAGPQ